MVLRRFVSVAAPVGALGAAGWAGLTTVNDDWDEVFRPEGSATKEKIVVLGSGWGAMQTVRKLGGKHRDVVVVSPRPHFLYTPLLAGSAVGTVSFRSVIEPFRDLIDAAAVRMHSAAYVRAAVRDVDFDKKIVYVALASLDDAAGTSEDLAAITYDKLVVAVGAEPATFGIEGVKQHALAMKEVSDADAVRQRVLGNLERAAALAMSPTEVTASEVDQLLHFVVVGGGPTGVELAGELADFCREDVARRYGAAISKRCRITLVEAMPRVLASFDADLADVATESLRKSGVQVLTSTAVSKIESKRRAIVKPSVPFTATPQQRAEADKQAKPFEYGALVWAAGIATRPLIKRLGERLGQADLRRGLQVDGQLRVLTTTGPSSSVYALGDCANSGHAPTAQVAAQQGRYLGRAIRDGPTVEPFAYNHAGSMAFIGNHAAIAQLPKAKTPSFLLWRGLHGATKEKKDGTPPAPFGEEKKNRALTGGTAFLFWRAVYFAQLLSSSNRFGLLQDWFKAETHGRDVVLPATPTKETDLARRDTVTPPPRK